MILDKKTLVQCIHHPCINPNAGFPVFLTPAFGNLRSFSEKIIGKPKRKSRLNRLRGQGNQCYGPTRKVSPNMRCEENSHIRLESNWCFDTMAPPSRIKTDAGHELQRKVYSSACYGSRDIANIPSSVSIRTCDLEISQLRTTLPGL